MHKAFPLPGIEFPLAKEVPTASKEGCHCQKKREATARKIALLLKSRRNCQSKSNGSFANDSYEVPSSIASATITDTTSGETGKKSGRTVTLTAEDMQKKKNDVKERTTLLLSLPDEHQLRFDKYKTAQELWAAILKAFGGKEATKKTKKNLLKQQYGNFKAEGSETLEQMFNRLQVIIAKHSSGNEDSNTASIPTASTSVATIIKDTADDIKWNMALLSMRANKFWKKTGKKISILGSDVAGFDKSKVECFNCHKMGPFARECRAPRSQDRGRRDTYRQGSKAKEQALKALMAIDRVGWDWSYMANDGEDYTLVADEEAPTEFALIANTKIRDSKERKGRVDGKLAGYLTALKDLDNLIESQRADKNKDGLGYNGSSQNNIDDKGYWDSGYSRHITGNISYLSNYEPFDEGYVSFGQGGCKITSKGTIKIGKQHKASRKSKLVNSVTKPLHTLHMDLFGPTFDETSGVLKKFITEIENLKDLKVKIIRCDNGGEFRNKEMNDFGLQKGIKREFSNARTPQQNGVAERRNRILIEAARTMVLVNESHNKTPYELFNGRSPVIGFLKPFGCHVMILNTLDNLGKFEEKWDEGYFIGYSMSSKAFRVFNKRTRRVEEKLHVEFLENKAIKKGVGPNWLFDIDSLTKSMNYVSVDAGTISTNLSGTKDATSHEVKKDVSSLRYISLPNWAHDALLEYSSSKPQDHCSTEVPEGSGNPILTASTSNPPADQMETLTVETPIPTVNILGVTTNSDESNGVEADISNMEIAITASPTPTLRIHKDHPKSQIIGPLDTPIQASNKFKEMDVKSAFLYGTIDEEVYEMQLPGFQDPEFPAKVYKVEKAMYGLHQALRAWYGTLSKYLLKNGFQRVLQKEDGIFISQDKDVGDILNKFGYLEVRSSNTPMDKDNPWGKHRTGKDVDLHLYRSMIGSLMYLTASRPDIVFVVCAYARHQVTPKECHLHAVKRIFRCLKGHPKLGLWYPKESPFDLVAYSDSDYNGATQDQYVAAASCYGQVLWIQNQLLDYGHNVLGRVIRTSKYWGILRILMISLRLVPLTIVATSTTEAEYVAAASCCGQVLWIQNQLLDYGHHFIRYCFEKKLNSVDHIHTDENVADLLIKPFDVGRFHYLVDCYDGNKMHKAFPLPGIEFPLAEEVPTASEEGCHCQKKRKATARKITLLSKSRRNYSYEVPASTASATITDTTSGETGKKSGRTVTLTAEDMQKKKNFMDVEIEQDDLNQKFLTSLAPEWHMHTIIWRNRSDLDTMSLDDLYNHLKVYESEVQKNLEPNSQNMALISLAKHSSRNEDGNSASVSTASTYVPTVCANIRVASISQDTAWKKISIQGSDVAGFDKSKAPKALMAINKVGWDWSYMANDGEDHALVADKEAPTEFALMANTSTKSKVFDNSLCSKDYKKNNDSLNKIRDSKEEKEGVDGKLAGFLTASKDLDNLIESQRADKNKDGLGYSAVSAPPAQIYSSPKKDLSWTGLLEFANDTVTNYSRPSPTMESTSGDDQNRNPSVSETEASPSVITPKPFIKFVKASDSPTESKINKAEKAKKSPVNGCSRHMTCNISYLSDYEPFDGGYMSFGQGGFKITGKGTIKTDKLEFENFYFVKDLKYNLFSVSQICDNKNSVLFTDSKCIMLGRDFKLLDDANILLRTPRQHNMYSIDLNNIVPHRDLTCLVAKASANECMLWYR
nr:hypothetical protein [Tanacetum cinerariifolium]